MAEILLWGTFLALVLLASVLALRYLTPIFALKTVPLARAAAAVLLGFALTAGTVMLVAWLATRVAAPWYVWLAIAVVVMTAISAAIARLLLQLDFRSTIRAGLLLIVAIGMVVAIMAIPLKFCYPTYAIPTNPMAPTLKGRHVVGVCPLCEGETVVSYSEYSSQFGPPETHLGHLGICTRCLQVSPATATSDTPQMGDRIIVRRLATPRRWDPIVFVVPHERQQLYVMRLVALPGESVEVKDGGIWIDGKRLVPPPEIAKLRWFLEEDQANWLGKYASPGAPTRLADDEYFVLGDFSPVSSDSRYWGPLPRANLRGVVSFVYFPPRSWKAVPRSP
jgi:signal peptidase I